MTNNLSLTKSKNIIFLYAEITPYLIGCLNYFIRKNKSFKLHIVYNNIFKNLEIKEKYGLSFISNKDFSDKDDLFKFCFHLNPCVLIVSGRMFNDYLYVSKRMKDITTRVTVQDTIYKNSLKQIITSKLSNILYLRYFDKFWGIGELQKKFARSIGFKGEDIFDGFYVADRKFFENCNICSFKNKDLNILFIGRLVKEKNIIRLIEVIERINKTSNSKHKVTIIGNGPLIDRIKQHNVVNYLGLKTQDEIIEIAIKCDVFCLPSTYEPWGVVTHEMAALGLPIISSILCGSSYDLVEEGYNGYKFNPHSDESIETAFKKFISLSQIEKRNHSSNSISIAKKINHDNWNKTILSIINNNI